MKVVPTPVSSIPIRKLPVGMQDVWTNVSSVVSVLVPPVAWVVVLITLMRMMDPGRLEKGEGVAMVVPLTVLGPAKTSVLECVFRLAIMDACNSVPITVLGTVSLIAGLVVRVIVPMIVWVLAAIARNRKPVLVVLLKDVLPTASMIVIPIVWGRDADPSVEPMRLVRVLGTAV